MVCNDQIKASVFMRNSCTVKCLEGKTAVFASDSTSGITKHSGWKIRKSNGNFTGEAGNILCPQNTVAASKFKDTHPRMNLALLINPWKPSLFILGIQTVQINAWGNVGGVLVLIFHAFLHACQVDQVKHLIPVYGMMGADRICGILDCLFHQLHLLDTVTYQL